MSEENNLKAKTKLNKKLLIGAVAVIVLALVAALAIFIPKSAEAKKLEEQLNLGDKYISELNYEQAEAAYLAVIEIDPKNVDAYLGLADAYIEQGEYDKAIAVLEDAMEELGGDVTDAINDKLEKAKELKKQAEVTPTTVPVESTPTPEPTITPTPNPTVTETVDTSDKTWEERRQLIYVELYEREVLTQGETETLYYQIYSNGEASIIGVKEMNLSTVTIPDEIEGYPVTEIGIEAFSGCENLKEIQFPSNLKYIEDMAFQGCGFEEFYVPEGVLYIGTWAFAGCYQLTRIVVPESIFLLGSMFVESCPSLNTIEILGENPYYDFVDGILYDDNQTMIHTVLETTDLTGYRIPEQIVEIGEGAFEGNETLVSIQIPSNVERIGGRAFLACYNLERIEFAEGVKEIGFAAIGDAQITSLYFPASITHIGDCVAIRCFELKEITVDEANQSYTAVEGVLFNREMTSLLLYPIDKEGTAYSIPEGVTTIQQAAFENARHLEKVYIPNTVEEIIDGVFDGCSENFILFVNDGSYAEQYAIENGIKVEN